MLVEIKQVQQIAVACSSCSVLPLPNMYRCLLLAALEAPATAATALAAAAGQLRRGSATSLSASRAAQKAQQTLEALNPTTAAQIAGCFPLSITGTWAGGSQQNQLSQPNHSPRTSSQPQHSDGNSSSSRETSSSDSMTSKLIPGPLPILGAHWLDADAIAVVCQQGYSSLLLVLGYSPTTADDHTRSGAHSQGSTATLRLQEQVEWMDQPVDRQWAVSGGLAAWGVDCQGTVMGVGPRVYLLGQAGGVFCGRLMPWSERLKTLQVCTHLFWPAVLHVLAWLSGPWLFGSLCRRAAAMMHLCGTRFSQTTAGL